MKNQDRSKNNGIEQSPPRGKLDSVLYGLDVFDETMGKGLRLVLLILSIIVIVGVLARYLFNYPFIWSLDLARFVYAILIIFLGAYAHRLRAHVNVNLIELRLSERGRAIARLAAVPFFFFFVIIFLMAATKYAYKSTLINEHLSSAWSPPVWPVKIMMPIGVFLLLLQGLSSATRDLRFVLRGKKKKGESL